MDIELQKNTQETRLVCRGNATAEAASEVRDVLLEALQLEPAVMIDIAGVKKVDITFLQLLVSAERTAKENDKSIQIDPSAYCDALIKSAMRGGFYREAEHLGSSSTSTILANYYTQVMQGGDRG
ncbi:MAG: STAS domain-containing protein [Spirochaetia bacterium]|nr:STAS domain-containing protein [Spirochaetia bacterium]